jgi:hypothetical protein
VRLGIKPIDSHWLLPRGFPSRVRHARPLVARTSSLLRGHYCDKIAEFFGRSNFSALFFAARSVSFRAKPLQPLLGFASA